MKTLKRFLTLIFFLAVACHQLFAETITIDNFDDNIIRPEWQVEGTTFVLSAENQSMRVDYSRTSTSWEWDQFHLLVQPLGNLYQFQLVFSIRSTVATQLAVKPVYTDGSSDWITKEISVSENFQTQLLTVSSTNPRMIETIYIYFDGGSTQIKSGIIHIDHILLQTTTTALLESSVSDAGVLLGFADEGSGEGYFQPGSKAVFAEAINAANAVLNDAQATQLQIDEALQLLLNANTIFESARVKSEKLTGLELSAGDASFETMNMYYNLRQIARYNTLFGMQDATGYGVGWTGNNFRSDVEDVCGSLPALCSWSVKDVALGQGFNDLGERIRYIYNKGGINTLEWHMDNPYGGDFYWENNPYPDSNVVRSILPGGVNHLSWRNQLDNIALFLKTLKGEKGESIPVIFRPWHEHTGDWFWWGTAHCSVDEYKLLWQFTVNYLTDDKQVKNVLFAFSPDRFYTKAKYLQRYPGDQYIDIFGFDDYGDVSNVTGIENLLSQLRHLVEMAEQREKIPALTETGLERITNHTWFTQFMLEPIKNDPIAKRIAYQAVWRNASTSHHYAPYPGHPSVPDFLTFFDDPFTIFLNDLPDIYSTARTINAPLSLDESSPEKLLIFPNPVSDKLYIQSIDESGSISIIDFTGKIVLENLKTDRAKNGIEMNQFSPGIYLVRLTSDSGESSYHKFVLVH